MISSKEIMARNIQYYMERDRINATDLCKKLGIKQNTFSDWIHAKTYPRIDKIELMANYFNISKAYLVEDMTTDTPALSPVAEEYTDLEKDLIRAFRNASPDTRQAVCNVLGVKGEDAQSTGAFIAG